MPGRLRALAQCAAGPRARRHDRHRARHGCFAPSARAARARRCRLTPLAAAEGRSPSPRQESAAALRAGASPLATGAPACRRLRERPRRPLLRFATAPAASRCSGRGPLRRIDVDRTAYAGLSCPPNPLDAPSSSSQPADPPARQVPPAGDPIRADAAVGIPDSALAGPFAVGEYAAALRAKLRSFARVQLVGELVNLRPRGRACTSSCATPAGALSCAAWREDWDRMVARAGAAPRRACRSSWRAAVTTTPAARPPRRASPSPSPTCASPARATCSRASSACASSSTPRACSSRRSGSAAAVLPRTIGVITGRDGKARDDVLAALARRGWAGRLVWGFAPVQDRHAAPAIVRALGDLAAVAQVDVVIVARGGGSLADLLCFCDETLCRTGRPAERAGDRLGRPSHRPHAARRRRRRQLLDADARRRGRRRGRLPRPAPHRPSRRACAATSRRRAQAAPGAAVRSARARAADADAVASRAPGAHLDRQRARLHQQLREMRARACAGACRPSGR